MFCGKSRISLGCGRVSETWRLGVFTVLGTDSAILTLYKHSRVTQRAAEKVRWKTGTVPWASKRLSRRPEDLSSRARSFSGDRKNFAAGRETFQVTGKTFQPPEKLFG